MIDTRPLGASGPVVSRLALGSWRTFERMSRDDGVAVMRRAREAGITFLDDARYDDETGTAPLPTGWSEVVFGELFRAAAELAGSLGRMGLDVLDLAYAAPLPAGLAVAECVAEVGGLIAAGDVRAWGTVNWKADDLTAAVAACADQ